MKTEKDRVRARQFYVENREYIRRRHNQLWKADRNACYAAYGGRCHCCGESEMDFLTIEHSKRDGNQKRRHNTHTVHDLKRRGYPQNEGIAILCMNCNMAEGIRGGCPHKSQNIAYGYCVG